MYKKNDMTNRHIQYWVIPKQKSGEFVAKMEQVLDIYALTFDAMFPVVCMDEQPVQLFREVYGPIPATKNHPKRVDYEYERAGTASIFMFTEPLAGWRRVTARKRRTMRDWAEEILQLLEVDYPFAKRVTLVCDNLNTHTIGVLYERFEAETAHRLASRLHLVHTPKHGSWLNIAECELSAMTRQCVANRRFETLDALVWEVTAWSLASNLRQKGVDWQFTTPDARIKLRSLYPNIIE